jgi:hypothetical protein
MRGKSESRQSFIVIDSESERLRFSTAVEKENCVLPFVQNDPRRSVTSIDIANLSFRPLQIDPFMFRKRSQVEDVTRTTERSQK